MTDFNNGENPQKQSISGSGYAYVNIPPGMMPSVPVDEENIDFNELLAIFFRRWKIMLFSFIAVFVAICFVTIFTTPVYQSTARILVSSDTGRRSSSDELPLISDLMGITQARSVQTQIEILKSDPIQEGALNRLNRRDREALKNFSHVDIKTVKDADIIDITVSSYSPKAAATLANAICTQYIDDNQQGNRQQTNAAAAYVGVQMEIVKKKLDKARLDLKKYKEKNCTLDLTAETQQKVVQLGQLEADLNKSKADNASYISQWSAMKGIVSGMERDQIASTTIAANPTVDQIKTELTRLELSRISMLQDYSTESPEIKRVDRQIAEAKQRLTKEAATEVRSQQKSLNIVKQSLTQDTAVIQSNIWASESRTAALESAAAGVRNNLSKLPEQEYRLAQLTTDLGVLNQTYQMLNEKYQSLRISEQARLANARILAPARPDTLPVKPQKSRNLALAFVLGLMVAAGVGFLIDRIDDRIYSEADIQSIVSKPILACIPYVAEEDKRLLSDMDKKCSYILLESFRMLRSNITFMGVDKPIKSLVITSCEPNEGKTTTAINLATAMAMDGNKVILVDADLRHPSVHKMMQIQGNVGFTNIVTGAMSLQDALQETAVHNLFVLAAGPTPPNPPEFLNTRASRECLESIFEAADFVVIDCPPAMIMPDAQVVARVADAVMMVVSIGKASKQAVIRTSETAAKSGANFLGVIMNKIGAKAGGYYGYYGYYGYHGYYHKQMEKYEKYYAKKNE
jgi:succinoglycan biosynthesis transport protein ExoP